METTLQESKLKAYEVPMAEIFCDHDWNCRGHVQPRDVDELVKSIAQVGLQTPIAVQPWKGNGKKYRIVAGHRRFIAFKVLSKSHIPATILEGLTDLAARKLNFEENLKREDLNILQEAKALVPFTDAGWTQSEIAEEFSKTPNWVNVRVSLLALPEDIQLEAAAGYLTQTHITEISKVWKKSKNRDAIDTAIRKIKMAKQLGEKKKIAIGQPKPKPHSKTRRERAEIFELMNHIQEHIGNFIGTRLLAWAAGEVSNIEIYRELRDHASTEGKKCPIPQALMDAS
jgi:ParB/RepB/Spo0J family partition protein